jgi:serine protein kinase
VKEPKTRLQSSSEQDRHGGSADPLEAIMRTKESDVFDLFSEIYTSAAQEEMSLQQYLLACREDASMYATAPERMVDAIGEPTFIDTSKDERLGRIFANRTIKIDPSFAVF